MPVRSVQLSQPDILRLSLACDLAEVRPVAATTRSFLVAQELTDEEMRACELALVEAINNAIRYARDDQRGRPIQIEVVCDDCQIEIRVRDQTSGFDWPLRADLPTHESETGRGLFLIQSLMDASDYFRGRQGNCLIMRRSRRARRPSPPEGPARLDELKRRLAESERVVTEMSEELSSCYESLSAIFRYSAELGKTDNLGDFAARLLDDLLQITAADWFVLRLVEPGQQHLNVFATSEADRRFSSLPLAEPPDRSPSVELEAARTKQDVWFDPQRPLNAADPLQGISAHAFGLVHPFSFGETFFGTLTLGQIVPTQPFTAAKVNVVHTFADFLATQIVNARLQEEQLAARLMSRELEIAREIQQALLPRSLPQVPGLSLAGFCESASQVGGDFYDVFCPGDDTLLLIIADVMGKGIPAAMFAAILRSLLRAIPELAGRPGELLTRVNRLLYDELSGVEMFITAQVVYVDARQRQLSVASAGHCPLLLVPAAGGAVTALAPEGMPLGVMPNTVFPPLSASWSTHARLLLYTDGLTDSRNPAGEVFGQKRLMDWLGHSTISGKSVEGLKAELVKELAAFRLEANLVDDLTFLVVAEDSPVA